MHLVAATLIRPPGIAALVRDAAREALWTAAAFDGRLKHIWIGADGRDARISMFYLVPSELEAENGCRVVIDCTLESSPALAGWELADLRTVPLEGLFGTEDLT